MAVYYKSTPDDQQACYAAASYTHVPRFFKFLNEKQINYKTFRTTGYFFRRNTCHKIFPHLDRHQFDESERE